MQGSLLWEHMTVNEIRRALESTRTILIPVGCIEQHGYHLPTRTDCYNAEGICGGASEETGALVAPTVAYAYSGGELPGTINIAPPVVGLVIMEILRDLSRQGFKNLVIVLGHGGTENDQAVTGAADMFLRTHPERGELNVAVYRFWKVSPTAMKAFDDHDYHAGYFETSMILHVAPEEVRDEAALDEPALVESMRHDPDNYQARVKHVDHEAVIPHIHQNPATRVGVIGDPARANAELGAAIFREAIAGLVELVEVMEGGG